MNNKIKIKPNSKFLNFLIKFCFLNKFITPAADTNYEFNGFNERERERDRRKWNIFHTRYRHWVYQIKKRRNFSHTLKLKPNHPNGSAQKSQDRKKKVKFVEMGRFSSLFSSIELVWWIMKSCHKIVRSIRNTNLKLWADCEKQYVRNTQNSGKTNHGFYTMITCQLTDRCLCLSFWPKTKPLSWLNHRVNRNWPPLTFSCSQNWRHRWKGSVLLRLTR